MGVNYLQLWWTAPTVPICQNVSKSCMFPPWYTPDCSWGGPPFETPGLKQNDNDRIFAVNTVQTKIITGFIVMDLVNRPLGHHTWLHKIMTIRKCFQLDV